MSTIELEDEPESAAETLTPEEAGTATPEKVIKLATEQVDLPRIALIGIFGSDSARGALVREKDGEIRRVAVGDKAAGGTVAAIGQDRLIIAKRLTTKVLTLPAI